MALPGAAPKKIRGQRKKPLAGVLPELLSSALDKKEDFIVTCEIDPDTGTEYLYALSVRFVSPCMLRKLIGKAESQRDEGSVLLKRRLPKKDSPE